MEDADAGAADFARHGSDRIAPRRDNLGRNRQFEPLHVAPVFGLRLLEVFQNRLQVLEGRSAPLIVTHRLSHVELRALPYGLVAHNESACPVRRLSRAAEIEAVRHGTRDLGGWDRSEI